jgi:hypothetical protein
MIHKGPVYGIEFGVADSVELGSVKSSFLYNFCMDTLYLLQLY